jgi:hypothetical protein
MEKGLTTLSFLWAIVPSLTTLYPVYAITESWTDLRFQPIKLEYRHEKPNKHICTGCISDVVPRIRLLGIGERNHR